MRRKIFAFLLTVVMLFATAAPVLAGGASGGTSFTEEELAEIQAREDQQFAEYLKTNEGQAWLATDEGRAWLNTDAGKRTLENYGPINIPEATNTQGGDKNQGQANQSKPTVNGTGKFTDVPDDAWYAEAVNAMADSGILSGYGDGTFRPNQNITVGELCAIMWRLCGASDQDGLLKYLINPSTKLRDHFDTYNTWAGPFYDAAGDGGLVRGLVSHGGNNPQYIDQIATRGQAIDAIMTVLINTELLDTEVKKNDLNLEVIRTPNPDKDKNPLLPDTYTVTDNYIGDWDAVRNAMNGNVYKKIVSAYNYGVVNGVNDSHDCNPNGDITRAELITMIYNTGVSSWPKELHFRLGYGDANETFRIK